MCVAAYGNCAHMLKLKTWGITFHAIQELVALVQIADHLCSNWTYSIVRVCVNYGNHLKSASGYVNKKHIFVAKKKSDANTSLFCSDKWRARGKICTWLLPVKQMWILQCISCSVSVTC